MSTLPSAADPPSESAPLELTYLCLSYSPGRGLGYSLFIHAIALTILLLLPPIVHSPTERFRLPQRATKNNRSEDMVVMYLPSIGGGGQGVGGGLESSGNEPTAAPSSGTEGLIYPGPQLIRSDSPQPTNRFQTLLQLELEDLPILNPRLDFLNLLPMPEVSLVPQSEPPDPVVGPPDTIKSEEQQPVDPFDSVATEAIQPTLEPQLPTPIDASKPVVPARLPSRDRDLRSVLALTPLPTWREQPVEIPAGEALGRFTISPEPNLDTSETEPGSPSSVVLENPTVGPAGENADIGNSDSVVTLTFEPSVGAKGKSSSSGSGGDAVPGSRPGSSASGPGVGSGWGAGSSPSKGALARLTIVGGVGGTETSGLGAGSSSSNGALAGLTIVGGVGRTEASVNSLPDSRIPNSRQTRYGLSVVSTENSGGGLPYFDVFSNAQINTVYLDMRQTETDETPFWTLEFAVPRGAAIQANPARELDESYEGFVLPVPVVKEQPALPLELVRRHIGKMVIVYTVINVEGNMEQISVKESPDPLLNQPLLDALSKWVFRPGVLNGDPVAVKALLGIPVWLPLLPG